MNTRTLVTFAALLLIGSGPGRPSDRNVPGDAALGAGEAARVGAGDCVFQKNPTRYRDGLRLHIEQLSMITERVAAAVGSAVGPVQATDVPSRNYIDTYIFDKMAADGIPHAPLAGDSEFLRRVYLDLTGRIPASAQVRAFLASQDPSKRTALVQGLVGSPEFVDRWTMFYGDLLRNTAQDSSGVRRFPEGRNAFYDALKTFVSQNTPYDVFVKKILTGAGNSYTAGETNWSVGAVTPMGPPQDTADTLAVRAATQFLGLSNLDCLLCHNGAGHLDKLNVWATGMARSEAWKLSAFFARTRITRNNVMGNRQYSWEVSDAPAGDYQLNTTSGNRTPRQPIDGQTLVRPSYIFAPTPVSGGTYRETFANNLVRDRQFARAAVNYLWREMMGQGIVEPADQFDPARLDPKNPPPPGWTLQPSHPELLEALADDFVKHGYDVRYLLALIANSNAYQLSSMFPDEWRIEYEPYFARKLVRRLWAEELHDAIAQATGILGSYTPQAYTRPVQWAMQLPDTVEPRSNVLVAGFLNAFLRGNRDTALRSGDASIPQALQIMNSTFVTTRIRSSDPNTTVAKLLRNGALSDSDLVDELFLATLGRFPSAAEKQLALAGLRPDRAAGAENLQWVLLNKVDFLYNH